MGVKGSGIFQGKGKPNGLGNILWGEKTPGNPNWLNYSGPNWTGKRKPVKQLKFPLGGSFREEFLGKTGFLNRGIKTSEYLLEVRGRQKGLNGV